VAWWSVTACSADHHATSDDSSAWCWAAPAT